MDKEGIIAVNKTDCSLENYQKTDKTKLSQYSYKPTQVRNDMLYFTLSLLQFQLVEFFVMFTVTMSNERLNLDAPVLYDSVLTLIPKSWLATELSEIILFSYQIWLVHEKVNVKNL